MCHLREEDNKQEVPERRLNQLVTVFMPVLPHRWCQPCQSLQFFNIRFLLQPRKTIQDITSCAYDIKSASHTHLNVY